MTANEGKQTATRQNKTQTAPAKTAAPIANTSAALDAITLSAGAAARLQRSIGNRRTNRLIQARLTVGAAHDPLEQEADRVAERVVNRSFTSIQRSEPEEDELLTKRDGMMESFDAGSDFEQQLGSSGSGSPLDNGTRARMEAGIGADFSRVRVHTDAHASSLNRSISARAFTRGSDVFFDRGQYNPGNVAGQRLIAHELAHVVQQGAASQMPVQRWPWSKKNKPATGNDSTTPSSDEGETAQDTLSVTTPSTDTAALTINPDYTNDTVKDQAPTRFKFSVLVWQENKNYLDFQKIRAWSMMRNRMRDMFRKTQVGKLFVRKGKTSAEVKQKTARTVASQEAGYANMDPQQQTNAINTAMSQSNDLGHTWSRLTAYTGDEVKDIYSFGFWPKAGIQRPDQPTEGNVKHPDTVHDDDSPLRVMHYDIPATNYQTALKWADGQVQSPPQYKMIGLNCTSWSRMLAGKAGVSLPSSANVFPAEPAQGFFQSIHSPNRLYGSLGEQKGVEDKIDAIPQKKLANPHQAFWSAFNITQSDEESSSESIEPPELKSVHKLKEGLKVTTTRGERTIPAGSDIMVTEVQFDGEIRVESAAVRGNFDSVIRGTTNAKDFWAAVNGAATQDSTSGEESATETLSDHLSDNQIGTLRASNDDIQYVCDMGVVDADVLRGLNEELVEELAGKIDVDGAVLRRMISELT